PFSITPDSKYLFLTKQYESALDALEYSVRERLGFSVLTGEVGTGKTTIARTFLSKLGDGFESALLVNPLLSIPEMLQAINKDFGCATRVLSPQRQIESLNKFLLDSASTGKNAVVIIDEAQNLSVESLEMLRMLTNIETDRAKLLQIVLVGQPELTKKLETYELRQLNQRITVRANLVPLQFVEMVRYINHRVTLAGGLNKIFFDATAYKAIWRSTKGFPRLVNIICDRALMAAYVADTATISGDIIRRAVKDIGVVAPRTGWLSALKNLKVNRLLCRLYTKP
ncbi:MAG: ATPase, partial [Deltaproteobacteria bacterium CG_4_10_14_0_2_um_filter_43_8]